MNTNVDKNEQNKVIIDRIKQLDHKYIHIAIKCSLFY